MVSLDIVIDDCDIGLDENISQIVPMLVHFSIRFRHSTGLPQNYVDHHVTTLKKTFNDYQTSIKELYHRILYSTLSMKRLILIEERFCGLTIWASFLFSSCQLMTSLIIFIDEEEEDCLRKMKIVIIGGELRRFDVGISLLQNGFNDVRIYERDSSMNIQRQGYDLTIL